MQPERLAEALFQMKRLPQRIVRNKRYALIACLVVLILFIVLLINASKINLRSSSQDLGKVKLANARSYSENLRKRIPMKYRIDEDVLLEQKSKDPEGLLMTIFERADHDKDKKLDEKELAMWMHVRIVDHLDKAINDNIKTFKYNDVNHDGRMSWKEFFVKFLAEKGIKNRLKIKKLSKDHSSLRQSVKEELAMYKASWSQSEISEPGFLNINEYLSFMHPEHNHVTLINMVEEMITNLDDDGDQKVTPEEYCDLSNKHETDITDKEWMEKRKLEFNEYMDIDGNGVLMKRELLMYVDPKNPRRAIADAQALIKLSDKDKDHKISLDEMLAKSKSFIDSKAVHVAYTLHSEF